MKSENSNQKAGKILLVFILSACLIGTIIIFLDSLNKKYSHYIEISTIYDGISKSESDGEISIRIDTQNGIFSINNIVSNHALYDKIKDTLAPGDKIEIFYYGRNWVIGIDKDNQTVLDLDYALTKLEKNNRLSIIILPVMAVIFMVAIAYTILRKTREDQTIIPINTLRIEEINDKKVINLKMPKYIIIIHTCVLICSFVCIPFLIKIRIWYVTVFFGILIVYNLYRFIGLFIRKIELYESNNEIFLFMPFKKRIMIDDIEFINTLINEDHEGMDRYFVEFKLKNKRHVIKFETTSDEQSNSIKCLFHKD